MVFNTPSACGGVTDQKRVQGLPWGLIPFIADDFEIIEATKRLEFDKTHLIFHLG